MSILHRFQIEEDQAPDARQWKMICRLLKAIITNPSLVLGDESSRILFPDSNPAKVGTTAAAAAAVASGAFYGLYTVVDDPTPANDGDIYLQGGTINGLPLATEDLLLYDISTDTWQGTAGQHLYVPVTGAFEVVDSVALPGFTAASLGTPAIGALPSDTFPAVTGSTTASSGTHYLSLGVFTATSFLPAASGNRVVSLCITPPYSVS